MARFNSASAGYAESYLLVTIMDNNFPINDLKTHRRITLMPEYGVHAFFLEGFWNNEIAPRVNAQAAELGFDGVEMPLLRPDQFDSDLIGAELSRNHTEGVTSLSLPREPATHELEFLKANAAKVGNT